MKIGDMNEVKWWGSIDYMALWDKKNSSSADTWVSMYNRKCWSETDVWNQNILGDLFSVENHI